MTRGIFAALTRNTVSLVGTALVVACATLIVTLFIVQLLGFHGGAYLGIVTFLLLPMLLAVGLVLIPVGISRERRRMAAEAASGGVSAPRFPIVDLNEERTRRGMVMLVLFTTVSVVILAAATYKGVEIMDSVPFCGQVCHAVMKPEYTAYRHSPHARVPCADCHIGPGADWFVKSKLSGSWQLIAVTFNLYPRPIPVPIENLRPARETCEQCHWPTAFVGDLLRPRTKFAQDEANTAKRSAIVLKVGGAGAGGPKAHAASGIHWHVSPGLQIRYRADATRETIYDVELTLADGTVTLFEGEAPPTGEAPEWRTMDCLDCHNRPSHSFELPDAALDRALAAGLIDAGLPFVKREGLRLLQADYEDHAQARAAIPADLRSFYESSYPDLVDEQAAAIEEAAARLVELYTTNVFPSMKVGWGTYPNHIGHQQTPGCFRCHDSRHRSADGRAISRRCDTCHVRVSGSGPAAGLLESLSRQ